jgi:transcriptional regulator with GAF, ATPase, and Fis domain
MGYPEYASENGERHGSSGAFIPASFNARRTSHPAFQADVPPQLQSEAASTSARAQVDFQRLVADMSARFSAIDPLAVDDAIVDTLDRTADALELDWAVLWSKRAGDATPLTTHHWVRPSWSGAPEPDTMESIARGLAVLPGSDGCCFKSVDDLPERARDFFRNSGLRSGVTVSLPSTGEEGLLTALACGSSRKEQKWPPAVVERVRLIAGVLGQALAGKACHAELQKALHEVGRLRDRLGSERVDPRSEMKVLRKPSPIVSESAAMRRVFAQLQQVAPTPATVLLLGETGSGKEVMAQAIHDLSPRRQKPMIRVNCAAIPTALIESELFGRERGAYTGALSRQIGRFEAAHQSTLFLDEIGDLSVEVQIKLLRVLQERVIERLGSTQPIKVDVRIIAATNQRLEEAIRAKTFREDLFYRLNVFPVNVPPLRERTEDIPALAWTFVDEFSRSFGKPIDSIPKECLRQLQRYEWPGNVRELRNIVERAVIVAKERQLVIWPPRAEERPMPPTDMTLCAFEGEHIRSVLEKTNWRVRGSLGAAERLGLKPTTLESRMARLGITRKNAR